MSSFVAPENEPESNVPAARVINPAGTSQVLLVCEHASNRIPARYEGLGLSENAKSSHAAWDPGALPLAEALSAILNAKVVASTVSRLVYDCNRPPEALGAMPARSEIFDVPANSNLSDAEKQERVTSVYEPFRSLLAKTISKASTPPVLVTIHSFTPVYLGKNRAVEIGAIHDVDASLSEKFVALGQDDGRFQFELNEPYSAADGVAHTLAVHGTANGLANIMIEVRNDLLADDKQVREIAELVADLLRRSLAALGAPLTDKGAA